MKIPNISNNIFKKAYDTAINNGQEYHLASLLYRKKRLVCIGTNSHKTHPSFKRTYEDGKCGFHMHAEMDALRFVEKGDIIVVLRFNKKGDLMLAKPCIHCQGFLKESGVSHIVFSDRNGLLKPMSL